VREDLLSQNMEQIENNTNSLVRKRKQQRYLQILCNTFDQYSS